MKNTRAIHFWGVGGWSICSCKRYRCGGVAVSPYCYRPCFTLWLHIIDTLNYAMMKQYTGFLSAALLTLIAAPAAAVNKCVNDAGQVVYQANPCPATAKGSELTLQKAPPPSVTSAADAEELKRIQQTAGKMERERKLTEIDREIKVIEDRIVDHRRSLNREMENLQRKKRLANNNLAGATWEQSISDEMTAVSQKYDALIRNDQSRIDLLRTDAERLRQSP